MILVAEVDGDVRAEVWSRSFTSTGPDGAGVFRLTIRFGAKRRKISCQIKSPRGLDLDQLRLAKCLIDARAHDIVNHLEELIGHRGKRTKYPIRYIMAVTGFGDRQARALNSFLEICEQIDFDFLNEAFLYASYSRTLEGVSDPD